MHWDSMSQNAQDNISQDARSPFPLETLGPLRHSDPGACLPRRSLGKPQVLGSGCGHCHRTYVSATSTNSHHAFLKNAVQLAQEKKPVLKLLGDKRK